MLCGLVGAWASGGAAAPGRSGGSRGNRRIFLRLGRGRGAGAVRNQVRVVKWCHSARPSEGVGGVAVRWWCRAKRTAEVAREAVAAGARRCGADARRRRAFRLPCVRATGQHRGEVGETTELRSRMP